LINIGRGIASQPCKLAGTRSMVELLVAWMFIFVFLFFVFARWRVFHACTAEAATLADWQGNIDHNSRPADNPGMLRRGMVELEVCG